MKWELPLKMKIGAASCQDRCSMSTTLFIHVVPIYLLSIELCKLGDGCGGMGIVTIDLPTVNQQFAWVDCALFSVWRMFFPLIAASGHHLHNFIHSIYGSFNWNWLILCYVLLIKWWIIFVEYPADSWRQRHLSRQQFNAKNWVKNWVSGSAKNGCYFCDDKNELKYLKLSSFNSSRDIPWINRWRWHGIRQDWPSCPFAFRPE